MLQHAHLSGRATSHRNAFSSLKATRHNCMSFRAHRRGYACGMCVQCSTHPPGDTTLTHRPCYLACRQHRGTCRADTQHIRRIQPHITATSRWPRFGGCARHPCVNIVTHGTTTQRMLNITAHAAHAATGTTVVLTYSSGPHADPMQLSHCSTASNKHNTHTHSHAGLRVNVSGEAGAATPWPCAV